MVKGGDTSYKQTKYGILPRLKVLKLEVLGTKKGLILLKGFSKDNKRIKDLLTRMAEQVSNMARKEEVLILQRQFDLFREHKKEK